MKRLAGPVGQATAMTLDGSVVTHRAEPEKEAGHPSVAVRAARLSCRLWRPPSR
jgi:hypothetical protein